MCVLQLLPLLIFHFHSPWPTYAKSGGHFFRILLEVAEWIQLEMSLALSQTTRSNLVSPSRGSLRKQRVLLNPVPCGMKICAMCTGTVGI